MAPKACALLTGVNLLALFHCMYIHICIYTFLKKVKMGPYGTYLFIINNLSWTSFQTGVIFSNGYVVSFHLCVPHVWAFSLTEVMGVVYKQCSNTQLYLLPLLHIPVGGPQKWNCPVRGSKNLMGWSNPPPATGWESALSSFLLTLTRQSLLFRPL